MRLTKQFQLLVSAPSDISEEIDIVKKVVNSFNYSIGKSNGVSILSVNWKDNSFPESGGQPQELLNKQIVDESDAVVAIFWTKFGSPTSKYDSGTEEEIEKMIDDGKQVFLYFCDKEVNIKTINYKQWEKIQNFKKKYENRGIYFTYNKINDFEKHLFNHLILYFLNLKETTNSNYEIANNRKSNLIIKSYNDNDNQITDTLNYYSYDYSNSRLFEDFLNEIKESIRVINSIKIEEITKIDLKVTSMINMNLGSKEEIKFNKTEINVAENFIESQNLPKLNDNWTNIGNLYRSRSLIPYANLHYSYSLIGSNEEKEKYRNIKKLIDTIKRYIGFNNFFTELDSYSVLTLIILNNGNTYDEDINITLFLKSNTLIHPNEFAVPSSEIVDEIEGLLPSILVHKKTHNIGCYPVKKYIDIPKPYLGGLYSTKSNKAKIESYRNDLESSFFYDFYHDDDYDIIKFNLNYLKHNDKLFFPTNLFFKKEINELKYEITSKHFPTRIEGEIKLK